MDHSFLNLNNEMLRSQQHRRTILVTAISYSSIEIKVSLGHLQWWFNQTVVEVGAGMSNCFLYKIIGGFINQCYNLKEYVLLKVGIGINVPCLCKVSYRTTPLFQKMKINVDWLPRATKTLQSWEVHPMVSPVSIRCSLSIIYCFWHVISHPRHLKMFCNQQ